MLSAQADEKAAFVPWFLSDTGNHDDAVDDAAPRQAQPVTDDTPTILVVDDDLANLALAEALLRAEGFRVQVAMDGASMFRALKTCAPALILMDIQLPESDGWELTSQLKAEPSTRDIPVIAITAYGKVGDDRKARQAGFVEFLSKPVSTRELPAIVRRHLIAR